MKLFYGTIENGNVEIHPDEQQHIIKVLRMKSGDEISVTNGNGTLAKGTINIEGKKVLFSLVEIKDHLPNFQPRLHLAIAPTKNIDRTEFFVEKAVEMGISEITFLLTEKSERKNLNLERFQKQAISASKQSLRFHFPVVHDLTKLSDFIKNVNPQHTFVAHCHDNLERMTLNEMMSENDDITFLIGPEGDFSEKEIQLLAENNIKAVSLGTQRLRTETAGIFVAAWNYGKMI